MPIKNLTLGAVVLLSTTALAHNHHNTTKAHSAPRTHLVRRGETLDKIAKWTGVSKKQIIVSNDLYSKKFKPGLVLHIPDSTKTLPKHLDLNVHGYAPYTLRPHDSDWKVANMFHMTPQALRHLNPSVAWNHPHPGTKIQIPLKNAFIYKLAKIPVIRSRYAMVVRPDTIVRNAPGSNAHRVAKVDAGRQVRVLDRDDHWYKVRFEQGTEGWVRGDLLATEQPTIIASRHSSHRSYESDRTVRTVAYHIPKHSRDSRDAGFSVNLPATGGDMLSFAETFKGTPYRYGAASRSGTDCSGFVGQVLKHEGVRLPRTAAEQSQKGQHVDRNGLKPGDLLFFHTSRGDRISHVAIYMGDNKFIHASSGGGKVQINSLNEGYYNRRFATARRVAKVGHHGKESEKIAKARREDERAMREAEKEIKTNSDGN